MISRWRRYRSFSPWPCLPDAPRRKSLSKHLWSNRGSPVPIKSTSTTSSPTRPRSPPIPISGTAKQERSIIIVGATKIYGEASGSNTLEGRAKATADAIAAELKIRFRARGSEMDCKRQLPILSLPSIARSLFITTRPRNLRRYISTEKRGQCNLRSFRSAPINNRSALPILGRRTIARSLSTTRRQ